MPGWRQRLARDRSRSPPPRDRTALGFGVELTHWLRDWAWGRSPAVDIVRNSANKLAADTRLKCPVIRRLARCKGNEGNAERLVQDIIPRERLPQSTRVEDSTIDTVLLPTTLFSWLQQTNPRKFRIHMGARAGGVSEWWAQLASSVEGQDLWALHPWLRNKTPQDLKWHLPLMLFDDAGPVSKANSSFARCFYSLLGTGSERETRIILATGFKQTGVDRSWDPILASFEELAGDVEEGKWGGVLLFTGTDLEYCCNEFGMRHYNSKQICGYCGANDTDLPHTDNSPGASWRHTIRNNVAFIASFRQPRHPFIDHPLFNLYTYRLDIMHLLDHHGVTSHVAGNMIYIHVRDRDGILPGDTIDQRLEFFNNDVKAYYSHRGASSRLPPLRQSNLSGESGYPELHGPLVKAANTRHLVPFLLDMQERATRASPTHRNRHMLKVAQSLNKLYELFYGAGHFLSEDEKNLVYKHCNRLGQHYQLLAVQAVKDKEKLWKQQPKLHYVVAHLPTQSRLINPRFVHGYTSESMVGAMADIYTKSMSGPHHRTVQIKFATKYGTALMIDWTPGALI